MKENARNVELKYQESGADRMTREMAAKGFYPFKENELKEKIDNLLGRVEEKDIDPNGVIVPHAGYRYSGKTAAHAYKSLKGNEVETAVILGVNHTGMGDEAAVSTQGWRTPLGEVRNDEDVTEEVLENSYLERDESAHAREHSIEVQVPFLKYLFPDVNIVPVSLSHSLNKKKISSIGETLQGVIKNRSNTVLIGSSDLIHLGRRFSYHAPRGEDNLKYLKKKDKEFLDHVKELDLDQVIEFGESSTVCGYIPISILIEALKDELKEVKVLHRSNSYEVTGDKSNIVGYASVAFL